MADKDLLEKKIGAEGEIEITLKDGKLRIMVGYDGKGADAGLYLDLEPEYLLDKLAAVIPGKWDDMALDLVKGYFK